MNTLFIKCGSCGLSKEISLDSEYLPDFLEHTKGWMRHELCTLSCPNLECQTGYKHRYSPMTEEDLNMFALPVNKWKWRCSEKLSKRLLDQNFEDIIEQCSIAKSAIYDIYKKSVNERRSHPHTYETISEIWEVVQDIPGDYD